MEDGAHENKIIFSLKRRKREKNRMQDQQARPSEEGETLHLVGCRNIVT